MNTNTLALSLAVHWTREAERLLDAKRLNEAALARARARHYLTIHVNQKRAA